MGAEFLFAHANLTNHKTLDSWADSLRVRIDYLPSEDLQETALEIVGEELPDQEIRDLLYESVDYLAAAPRDAMIVQIAGKDILVAGGMSWDDDPSEAWTHLVRLDAAGLLW
jgi:hypothetical protein